MTPESLAHRLTLLAVLDTLPTALRVKVHTRLAAIVTRREIPGAVPGTTFTTDVRAELDHLIGELRRSCLVDLGRDTITPDAYAQEVPVAASVRLND